MLIFVAAVAVTVLVVTRDRGPSRRWLSRSELTWVLGGVLDLISADRRLMQHLVLESRLPVTKDPQKGSRIDARYSSVATSTVFSNTQVRCWSAKDWAAIRRETSALGEETSRKFYGAEASALGQRAWQLYRTKRLHASLWSADCRNGGPLDKDASARWP